MLLKKAMAIVEWVKNTVSLSYFFALKKVFKTPWPAVLTWNFHHLIVINRKLENDTIFKIDKEFYFISSYLLLMRNRVNLVSDAIFLSTFKKSVYHGKIRYVEGNICRFYVLMSLWFIFVNRSNFFKQTRNYRVICEWTI